MVFAKKTEVRAQMFCGIDKLCCQQNSGTINMQLEF